MGSRSALAVSGFRLRARLGFSVPASSFRPARRYPRVRIWRSSFERQRDLNPPEQRAAQRTLRLCSTPDRPASSVVYSLGALAACATTQPGLPGSSTDLSTRCPQPSRKARRVHLPVASPPVLCWLHPARRTGRLRFANEAESGSLALRLACSPCEFPPTPLLRSTLAWPPRTGNYMANSFQFTSSASLIPAHRAPASGLLDWTAKRGEDCRPDAVRRSTGSGGQHGCRNGRVRS